MLHCLEFVYRLAGFVRLASHEHADANAGKNVLHIV